jgi:hypothetical protein
MAASVTDPDSLDRARAGEVEIVDVPTFEPEGLACHG